jgi:hypothetical protein
LRIEYFGVFSSFSGYFCEGVYDTASGERLYLKDGGILLNHFIIILISIFQRREESSCRDLNRSINNIGLFINYDVLTLRG